MATLLLVFVSGVLTGRALSKRAPLASSPRTEDSKVKQLSEEASAPQQPSPLHGPSGAAGNGVQGEQLQQPSGGMAPVKHLVVIGDGSKAEAPKPAAEAAPPVAISPFALPPTHQQPQPWHWWRRLDFLPRLNLGGVGAAVTAATAGDAAVHLVPASRALSDTASHTSDAQDAVRAVRPYEAILPGPATPPPLNAAATAIAAAAAVDAAAAISHPKHRWYVDHPDLEFFQLRAEQDVVVHGAGPWTHLMDKELARSYRYSAWRRALPNGLTEYRSVMVMPDVSPLEYVDFSFDDSCRCRWEGFMVSAEVLEAGDQRRRQQVVRWIRSFPFGFITDRQYVIARALFSVTPDGAVHHGLPPARQQSRHAARDSGEVGDAVPVADLYCITKSIDHPGECDGTSGKVVQIPEYYSMWRCRSVACPWGGPRPAVEVLLLHSEDMRIPERLARMAISMGMSKFVHTMAAAMPGFVDERRRRCGPTHPDPLAYGHHHHVYGPAARCAAAIAAVTVAGGGGGGTAAAAGQELSVESVVAAPLTPPGAAGAPPPVTPSVGSTAAKGGAECTPGSVSKSAREGGGTGPAAGGAHAARALWHPTVAASSSAASPEGHRSTRSSLSSRFSLAEATLVNGGSSGSGGGLPAPASAEAAPGTTCIGGEGAPAVGGASGSVAGGGGAAAAASERSDPWAPWSRAMTSFKLGRLQDLPESLSSAWGTRGGSKKGRGQGGAAQLLRRAVMAAMVLTVVRHWRSSRATRGEGRRALGSRGLVEGAGAAAVWEEEEERNRARARAQEEIEGEGGSSEYYR